MEEGVKRPAFRVGQLVHHKLFDYRGVVIGVDKVFKGTEEWYQQMARSGPPKDQPWYHVLVHNASHQTYVAARNLTRDTTGQPVQHPLVDHYFLGFERGVYIRLLN